MKKFKNTGSSHKLVLDARKEAKITGVDKVISFEPDIVYLITNAGKMKINRKRNAYDKSGYRERNSGFNRESGLPLLYVG